MTAVFNAAATGVVQTGGATTMTIVVPSGALAGDIAVVAIGTSGTGTVTGIRTPTTVFTSVGSIAASGATTARVTVYAGVLAAGDLGATVTATTSSNMTFDMAALATYTGGASVSFIDSSNTHATTSGTDATSIPCTSATSVNANVLPISVLAGGYDTISTGTITPPSGYTARSTYNANFECLVIADAAALTSAGTVYGSGAWTLAAGAAGGATVTMAIVPAAGGATAAPAPATKIMPGAAWKVKWVPQGPRQVTSPGASVPVVPPTPVSGTDTASATDGGESVATISPVSSSDTASAADTGSVIGEGVSSTDVASASDTQNLTAKPASTDTASAADAQAVPPGHLSSADTASAADTGVLRQPGSDTASAADTGLVSRILFISADTGHGEDSGFAYISSADTASAAEVTGPPVVQAADTGTGNDLPTRYWITDTDTGITTENGVWTGPVNDSDTALAQEGMPVLYVQDTGVFPGGDHPIATDGQPNPAIDVYTYVPPSVVTVEGGFQLVWHHPQTGQRMVLWEGPRVTGEVLARAMDLHTSTEVQFPYDTDLSRSEDEQQPTLSVTVTVQSALNVAAVLV